LFGGDKPTRGDGSESEVAFFMIGNLARQPLQNSILLLLVFVVTRVLVVNNDLPWK